MELCGEDFSCCRALVGCRRLQEGLCASLTARCNGHIIGGNSDEG